MEGATSTLELLKNGWVRKTLKRKEKKKAMSVESQLIRHTWSSQILIPSHGFHILFTPPARASTSSNSYEMGLIDTSNPIVQIDTPELEAELELYFKKAKNAGYYPSDFELYLQSDGRIALVDFDKFGTIHSETRTVVFPYRGSVSLNTVPEEALYTEKLAKRIQSIMKGGRRKTRKRHSILPVSFRYFG
jgi:hypothetical protein